MAGSISPSQWRDKDPAPFFLRSPQYWSVSTKLPIRPLHIYMRIRLNQTASPFTILFLPKEFSTDLEARLTQVPEEEVEAPEKPPHPQEPSWGPAFGAKDGPEPSVRDAAGGAKASSLPFKMAIPFHADGRAATQGSSSVAGLGGLT